MRNWRHRSVYWRYVVQTTSWFVGEAAIGWLTGQNQAFILLFLPLLVTVGLLSMNLRCPRCDHRVMFYKVAVFVRGWPNDGEIYAAITARTRRRCAHAN